MSLLQHPRSRLSLPKGWCKIMCWDASHPNHTIRCKKAYSSKEDGCALGVLHAPVSSYMII